MNININKRKLVESLEFTIIFILGICILFLAGCGTPFCIKVDGKYQEKTGSIEYCYNPEKGIFTNAVNDAVLVTKKELEQIKLEEELEKPKEGEIKSKSSSLKLIDKILARFK